MAKSPSKAAAKSRKSPAPRATKTARKAGDVIPLRKAKAAAKPSAIQRAFLVRSMAALERLSQHASDAAITSALAAPTDLGALARVLADATVSDAATHELDPLAQSIARNAQHREELVALCGGLLSAPEAARSQQVSRQAIDKRRANGHLVAVKVAGDWLYPAFQFDERFPTGDLSEVLQALGNPGGWIALDFLLTPDSALGGKTPAAVMKSGSAGRDRVLRLARAERTDGYS